jgi:chaperonin cofactor prefoldin
LHKEETDDAHLESQLEEARRKEEVLKDQLEKKDEALERQLERARWKEEDLKEQLEEKDKAYQKLEAEVV